MIWFCCSFFLFLYILYIPTLHSYTYLDNPLLPMWHRWVLKCIRSLDGDHAEGLDPMLGQHLTQLGLDSGAALLCNCQY
jgi:hypothetical protein